MNPIFLGTIKEKGKLFLDKPDQFKQFLQTFPNEKRVEVTVEKLTHPRTNNQNRWYWGVVVAEISKFTGHDPENVHEFLKQRFSPKWSMANGINGEAVPTSTRLLDTIQFVEFTEKARIWANDFLGLQIPLPGEVTV